MVVFQWFNALSKISDRALFISLAGVCAVALAIGVGDMIFPAQQAPATKTSDGFALVGIKASEATNSKPKVVIDDLPETLTTPLLRSDPFAPLPNPENLSPYFDTNLADWSEVEPKRQASEDSDEDPPEIDDIPEPDSPESDLPDSESRSLVSRKSNPY